MTDRFFVNNWLRIISLIVCLGTFLVKGMAQSPLFKEYDLPDAYKAHLVIEDYSGFLWVGTENGVYRFDGVEWNIFLRPDSGQSEVVTALFQAKDSLIWVGYSDGKIFSLPEENLVIFNPEEGLPIVPITGFAEDREGHLWIATYGEGIYYFWKNRLYNIDTDDGLPANDIYTISEDARGRIWAGTDLGVGICSLKKGVKTVEIFNSDKGLPDNIVRTIEPAIESEGMWIGMYDGGVVFYDLGKDEMITFEGWDFGTTNCLLPQGNSVWIGTERNGLISLKSDQYQQIGDFKKISSLLHDHEGNTWIADQSGKLKMSIGIISRIPNLKSNILSVHEGSLGKLWFSTEMGLFVFYSLGQEIEQIWPHVSSRITSIYEDRWRKQLWVGTLGEGIWRIDLSSGRKYHYQEKDGLVNNHVMSIDGNQTEVWIATFGGVSRLFLKETGYSFENFTGDDGLGSDYIYKVLIDQKNRIWFATDGKGLVCWEDELLRSSSELADKTVLGISEDEEGILWISTDDGQIYAKNEKEFLPLKHYFSHTKDTPSAIVATEGGYLVIAYTNHVDMYHPESGRLTRLDDGLGLMSPGEDLNVIDNSDEGKVWLGTNNGIFCLESPHENTILYPSPRIKDVKIYLRDIENQNPMQLASDQNHLVFEYVGIWYQNPLEVSYEHRLIGYDTTWVKTRDDQAIYANLDPGSYRFELRAISNLTQNRSPKTVYRFRIRKPFWLTWWFLILSITAIAAMAWKWIQIREKRLRKTERLEQEKVRSRFETLQSQINPHFLFNSFNTLVSIIEDDQELAVEYVEKLSDFFRNILAYRDRQLITLDEELILFEDFHYLQKKRFGDNFQLQLDIDADLKDKMLPTLSLQLLVENIFKHNIISRSKPLFIYIETKMPGYLTVRNNLQKRKSELPSTRVGLENIAQRYQLLTRQEVKIEVAESEFLVHIPLLTTSTA